MISISTLEQHEAGSVILHEDPTSVIRDAEARVSRYGTLDGGAVIVHQGYSAGDRTLYVRGEISEEQGEILENLFQTQPRVHISTRIGFFLGAISRLKTDNGELAMSVYLETKLSA
jgi:hypothetical protein